MRQKLFGVLVGALALAGMVIGAPPAATATTTSASSAAVCSTTDWCTADNSARGYNLYGPNGYTVVAQVVVAVQRKWGSTGILYHRPYMRVTVTCTLQASCPYVTRSVQAGSSDTSDRVRMGSTGGGPALSYAPVVNVNYIDTGEVSARTWGPAYAVTYYSCCTYYSWLHSSFTTGQGSARLLSGELITLSHARSFNTDKLYAH
jgi:hypothetical protein